MIQFRAFFLKDSNEANSYIIACRETKKALLIDAGADTPDYDHFLQEKNAELTGIFLTHAHWDHDSGLASILLRHEVPVYSVQGNTPNGRVIQEGESIPLGNLHNRVYQTAGHTPDSSMLIVEDRFAFVGDTLFAGSIGGAAGTERQQEEQNHIRRVLFTLPEDAMICPGHGPLTTVGIEKNCNPFFV